MSQTEPERLSLTFRYVLNAPAAPPANIGGLRQFTVGDRVRAHWQRGSVAFTGCITAVDSKGRFSVNYDDGDKESDVDAKFLIPEVTPEMWRRNQSASERSTRHQARGQLATPPGNTF